MKKLLYLIPYIGFKSYVRTLPTILEGKDKLYYDIVTIYHGACIGFLVGFPVMMLVDLALS